MSKVKKNCCRIFAIALLVEIFLLIFSKIYFKLNKLNNKSIPKNSVSPKYYFIVSIDLNISIFFNIGSILAQIV